VLETAAGTGIVTRKLRDLLPARTMLTATDLNPPMLAVARDKFGRDEKVSFEPVDAMSLPFPDGIFDAVVCQFGVMFFPDKRSGYREARRVLKPGGHLLFSVWDRIEANEMARIVTDAVATLFPGDPPQFLARTPHGHHDTAAIGADLADAGFTGIQIDTVEKRSRAASHRDPAVGFCQGTPLRNEIEARDPARLAEATDAAAEAIASRFGRGPIDGKIQAHVITAVR
jgi:ubiquinone/menaquinone biosynthesis C-methylase UbiE